MSDTFYFLILDKLRDKSFASDDSGVYVHYKDVRYVLGCSFKIPKPFQYGLINDLKREKLLEVVDKKTIKIL